MPLHSTPSLGRSRRDIAITFGAAKTEVVRFVLGGIILLEDVECYKDTLMNGYDITNLTAELKSDSVQCRNKTIYIVVVLFRRRRSIATRSTEVIKKHRTLLISLVSGAALWLPRVVCL